MPPLPLMYRSQVVSGGLLEAYMVYACISPTEGVCGLVVFSCMKMLLHGRAHVPVEPADG
jgi:hypothetical protein